MQVQLLLCKSYAQFPHQIILIDAATKISSLGLANEEAAAAQKFFDEKVNHIFQLAGAESSLSLVKIDTSKEEYKSLEAARKAGNAINKFLNSKKIAEASVFNASRKIKLTAAFAEGLALSNYEFLKYKTKDKKEKSLTTLQVDSKSCDKKTLEEISKIVSANFFTRAHLSMSRFHI